MSDSTRSASQQQALKHTTEQLQQGFGLPLTKPLSPQRLSQAFEVLGLTFRNSLFNPVTTLFLWLSQIFSREPCCAKAVSRFRAFRGAQRQSVNSSDTSSFCQARKRLPQTLLTHLARQLGQQAQSNMPANKRLHGRPTLLVDGTTLNAPDTKSNQQQFPQPKTQKPGLGFPQLRIVALFCLATGVLRDLAYGPVEGKRTGENNLFRDLFESIASDTVVVGDRLYDNYRDIATLQDKFVDVLFRMNQSRGCDFRRGHRLGRYDHEVIWKRPGYKKDRYESREQYEALPERIVMRELRYWVTTKGFRTNVVTLVTTLRDPQRYPKGELTQVYRDRWHCEVDLRSLKANMGLGQLSCKSSEMVIKELWCYVLGYNLVRWEMVETGLATGKKVREISFSGTLQMAEAYGYQMAGAEANIRERLERQMREGIGAREVGNRPNRSEPRQIKHRQRKYPKLNRPRQMS